ncbi:unnamed protein product [Lupinus luteus]|uniref:Uncharacterized protein n=1 Tax=Lupinus luteus TaxID=3873 RepID=A0AAV1YB79_LUPLU
MGVNGESTPPPVIGKIGPYTVFITPPSTPKPDPLSPPPTKVLPPPVQPPPPQIHNPTILPAASSSVLGFLKDAVTKVQTAHSSLDDHLARWFGLNQSKYQWALDDYYETKGISKSKIGRFIISDRFRADNSRERRDRARKSEWISKLFVAKAKGGGLGFIKGDLSEQAAIDGKPRQALLAYINGDREFVLFDPYVKEGHELSMIRPDSLVALEETEQFGYTSIFGELPKFDIKSNKSISVLSAASERPWETIFRGESHMLPPLTKLCSEFLESLLEKRTAIVQ